MILARLTASIRAQNWFAVALEFVIVVAGVVIGFQITEWRGHQARLAQTASLTERLRDDMNAEAWRVAANRAYLRDVVVAGRTALEAMRDDRVADEILVINAFRASQYYWNGLNRATYDELVATGTIDLVDDAALRTAAVEYFSSPEDALITRIPDTTPYRDRFRQIAPAALHRQLVTDCGEDRMISTGDFEGLTDFLSFPCAIDGFEAEIAALADALRNDAGLAELLNWRIIEADQQFVGNYWFAVILNRGTNAPPPDPEPAP